MRGSVCGPSSFHPYECDGPGKCPHCDRREQPNHDPATCALCDPEYDYAPGRRIENGRLLHRRLVRDEGAGSA